MWLSTNSFFVLSAFIQLSKLKNDENPYLISLIFFCFYIHSNTLLDEIVRASTTLFDCSDWKATLLNAHMFPSVSDQSVFIRRQVEAHVLRGRHEAQDP